MIRHIKQTELADYPACVQTEAIEAFEGLAQRRIWTRVLIEAKCQGRVQYMELKGFPEIHNGKPALRYTKLDKEPTVIPDFRKVVSIRPMPTDYNEDWCFVRRDVLTRMEELDDYSVPV